jgi:hypothetical protein
MNVELKRLAVEYLARPASEPRTVAIVAAKMAPAHRDALELSDAIDEARQNPNDVGCYADDDRFVPLCPGAMVAGHGFDLVLIDLDGREWGSIQREYTTAWLREFLLTRAEPTSIVAMTAPAMGLL